MAPSIIYGTAWRENRTASLVVAAVLKGFRAIDTACQPKHYREDLVGEALLTLQSRHGIKREDLFLQTKYTPIGGHSTSKPLPYDPSTSITTQINASFAKSLSNLYTTYLDSYILHSPLPTLEETIEAWEALGALQDSGKVRAIGVSNTYEVSILESLATIRPVQVVQNRWHERNSWDRDVCRYCKDHNIQYQSFWPLSGSPKLLASPELASVSLASKCTAPQALFKLAVLGGVTPLCGTTDEAHMEEAVSVPAVVITTSSEVESLSKTIWG
ncbi:Aldo-ket-red domain-containing protein [Mycena indigotica]|uniref:Aldo-ket-red domain-containing protein n=1 Tax=Mycena indigotica TaxID=2126181 RepID=A0A8H6TFE9_9AGAR|nr:Aldo-ket-red domain-containing protein [Mycena indigotica]KAF7315701.1 Aldo-ket-red domain-containing protein [Mycena indigotica]